MTDTFSDEDLWDMASDAALDHGTPLQDDTESVMRPFHRRMADLANRHHQAKQHLLATRQCFTMVLIGGKACDPELDLRLSELQGKKELIQFRYEEERDAAMRPVLDHHV
jgi:hypothetical protein